MAAMAAMRATEIEPTAAVSTGRFLFTDSFKKTQAFFGKARESADLRHQNLSAFVQKKIQSGLHPDTTDMFWDEWEEPTFPEPPFEIRFSEETKARVAAVSVIGCFVVFVVGLSVLVLKLRDKSRAKAVQSST